MSTQQPHDDNSAHHHADNHAHTPDHAHDPVDPPWKHDGVRVIGANQLDGNTAQTPGMDRKAAINFARTGAQKLWAGTVTIHANARTGAHHHGHLESVIYVVRGRARMRWGDRLEFVAEAGEFIGLPWGVALGRAVRAQTACTHKRRVLR